MSDGQLNIDIIHPNYVPQIWPVVGEMIDRAMQHAKGEINTDQLKVFLARGEHQLMVFVDDLKIIGAIAFEWINYPNDRVMHINAIGGKTTPECVCKMFAWAKAQGATSVRGSAHESVARLWRMKYGMETIYYVVEKRL
jgi:hypothetical protein